jgi:hypothetical protein
MTRRLHKPHDENAHQIEANHRRSKYRLVPWWLLIRRLFQSGSPVKLRDGNPACTGAVAFGTLVLAEHLSARHSESNFPKKVVT